MRIEDRRSRFARLMERLDESGARSPVSAALWPASVLYGGLLLARRGLYGAGVIREQTLAAPVASVGNVTVGGTGKTPMVEYLARLMLSLGRRPVILSRGYAAKTGLAEDGRERNDEYLVLHQNLPQVPHVPGPNRVASGRMALARGLGDCFILDDGFQHWRLHRDLDVALVDATDRSPARLLPFGKAREPASALRRADMIVVTRCRLVSPESLDLLEKSLQRAAPRAEVALADHRPVGLAPLTGGATSECDLLRGVPVLAFCGIGNPRAFLATLRSLGADVVAAQFFDDHRHYSSQDVASLGALADEVDAQAIVTTQKDAVKLSGPWPADRSAFAVKVQMEIIRGEETLRQAMIRALGAFSASRGE